MITFGPIPSRRLGRSLGINNIPPKICTYSCVYCQVGRTVNMQIKRYPFYDPHEIFIEVKDKVRKAKEMEEIIDYLTFVPDGEPTLDAYLGQEIDLLKPLGIKIAVITNSSLIRHKGVQEDLRKADWVSLKIDTLDKKTWRKINRPHGKMRFNDIIKGIYEFAQSYAGFLATETMFIKGINDDLSKINELADFLALLKPDVAYIAIPNRPPAEEWVNRVDEDFLLQAYQIFSNRLEKVECLAEYEGNGFVSTGDVEEDLLNITAVHPMREEAVKKILSKKNSNWSVIKNLVAKDQLIKKEYEGSTFLVRRFSKQ